MPCDSDEELTIPYADEGEIIPSGMTFEERLEFAALKTELDLTTRMLCSLLSIMPNLTNEQNLWLNKQYNKRKSR